jgi:AcrR family transcriptional regulator
MAHTKAHLKPRKTPVQARSSSTVSSIFEATIQVLEDVGLERLTTTRVAERAGVSVGTLYQYFPNKSALLAAVLERYLVVIVEAVEQACQGARGKTLPEIAAALVNSFLDAKLGNPKASVVLYSVASEVDGAEIVMRMTQRSQIAICDVLATAKGAKFNDLRSVSYMLSTAITGPVQGLLASGAPQAMTETVRQHLLVMTLAYLQGSAV